MIDVSVLVPIHNAEKYLRKSIGSIQAQEVQNIEILCLDDGSTDNTLQILRELQAEDDRIKVFSREDRGYGITMNELLDLAEGQYVINVDPDDWIEPNMFTKMLSEMDKDVDYVKCSFVYECKEGQLNYYYSDDAVEFCPRKLNYDMKARFFASQVAIWTCMIRRSFIEKHRIRFNPTPGAAYQDTAFLFQLNACANKVRVLPDVLYHYNKLNDNASTLSTRYPFAPVIEYNFMTDWSMKHPRYGMYVRSVLCKCRLGSYMWNMTRIEPKDRLMFADLVKQDFRNDWNWLDVRMFSEKEFNAFQCGMRDPEAFIDLCLGRGQ